MTVSAHQAHQTQSGGQNDFNSIFNIPTTSSTILTSQTNDEFTENIEIASLTEKYQKLESEFNQLKSITNEKDNQLTKSITEINNLHQQLDEITKRYSDIQAKYIEKQKEIENLKQFKSTQESQAEMLPLPLSSVFNTEMTPSPFDEIVVTSKTATSLSGGVQIHDEKKLKI